MKLPIIRQVFQKADKAQIETTINVLESISEARGITEEETNVIGELITNLCGALEVHQLVEGGMREVEAVNTFAKKVVGAVDKL